MHENYLKVPNLNDSLFDDVFRKIDPNCTRSNDGIEITFPTKLIEISDLSVITQTTNDTLRNFVPDLEQEREQEQEQEQLPLSSPYLEDKIHQDWMNLRPRDLHVDKVIEDLISFHRNVKGLSHFTTLKLVNTDVEVLNRLPRIFYFFEKQRNLNEDGEFLLPSVFDFLRYPHLYFFEDFFHIGEPVSNLTSTIYFLNEQPILIPYYNRRRHHYLSNRHDTTEDSVENFSDVIQSWNTHQMQYDFMCVCVDVINNWLAYVYNGHNFKDKRDQLDVRRYLMAIISFKQIMEGIYANKSVDVEFAKVANSFRLLDQLSNMFCGLIPDIGNNLDNENQVFDSLLASQKYVVSSISELFNGRNDQLKESFIRFVQNVFGAVNRNGINNETLREFRNTYTHGIYPAGDVENRFNRVFEQPSNISTLIFLLPQILIMAAGRSPQAFLEDIRKQSNQ